jgi:hypothetical protein
VLITFVNKEACKAAEALVEADTRCIWEEAAEAAMIAAVKERCRAEAEKLCQDKESNWHAKLEADRLAKIEGKQKTQII